MPPYNVRYHYLPSLSRLILIVDGVKEPEGIDRVIVDALNSQGVEDSSDN